MYVESIFQIIFHVFLVFKKVLQKGVFHYFCCCMWNLVISDGNNVRNFRYENRIQVLESIDDGQKEYQPICPAIAEIVPFISLTVCIAWYTKSIMIRDDMIIKFLLLYLKEIEGLGWSQLVTKRTFEVNLKRRSSQLPSCLRLPLSKKSLLYVRVVLSTRIIFSARKWTMSLRSLKSLMHKKKRSLICKPMGRLILKINFY